MKSLCYGLAILAIALQSTLLRAEVHLPAIISDHMVLMRAKDVAIWGHADPGEEVTVSIKEQAARATAGRDGRWSVRLNLADFGAGPFQLIVRGKNEITLSDVVVGEVWLASGQSNMEFLLKFTAGAEAEIAQSANPFLRQFRVKKAGRPEPAEDCQGTWVIAGPETAGEFTGVGYYFGKELQQTLKTPVGIINASWGGTFSELWTSRDAISRVPSLKEADEQRRKIAADYPAKKKAFVTEFAAWLEANQRQDRPATNIEPFAGEHIATDDWIRVKLPGPVAAKALPTTGAVWIRREVDVPPGGIVSGQEFKILIGQLEGFEEVYWNGKKVSETSFEKYPGIGYQRYFGIPSESVKAGANTLAVRIFAPVVSPSIAVSPLAFNAGPVSLVGQWLAKAEYGWPALDEGAISRCPKPPARSPGMMAGEIFNGVIHPLIPYALSGVIWYQGESNCGRAYQYRVAFPLLIDDWRQKWGRKDLPFYFCQLPGSGPKKAAPGTSEWAELRESQSAALQAPNTGQAVLIDLGESADLHPRDKKTVGERLARIALARQYGKPCVYFGPMYESMAVEGSAIRVKFSHAEGRLVAAPVSATYDVMTKLGQTASLIRNSPRSELEGFCICGEDRRWVWADAKIDGDAVLVWSSQVRRPVAVRYGWADNPTCNLFNSSGLPAAPFRTDDFPGVTAEKHFDARS